MTFNNHRDPFDAFEAACEGGGRDDGDAELEGDSAPENDAVPPFQMSPIALAVETALARQLRAAEEGSDAPRTLS